MNQQQPDVPASQPPTERPTPVTVVASKKHKTLALWLLIGPTALIVGSIILYAVVNFIFTQFTHSSLEPNGTFSTPLLGHILNIILFIIGAVSVMAWLPGIIVGIILLATEKKA